MSRKYRFKSRQEAEDAYTDQERHAHVLQRALMAVCRKQVICGKRIGNYRLDLFDLDSPAGPKVIVRRWAKDSIGLHIEAHNFEEWADFLAHCHYPADVRLCLQAARETIHRHNHPERI
jgi:hypothetical protein